MNNETIKINYIKEEKEIPIPKSFIELKYYYCQNFQELFNFVNYNIYFSKDSGEDETITEEKFEEQIKEISNLKEPKIFMFPTNSEVGEEQEEKKFKLTASEPSISNNLENVKETYEKIKNELNQVYQKKFDEYKKNFSDELDKKLSQILNEILSNININK